VAAEEEEEEEVAAEEEEGLNQALLATCNCIRLPRSTAFNLYSPPTSSTCSLDRCLSKLACCSAAG
jgi:hypothetical protein